LIPSPDGQAIQPHAAPIAPDVQRGAKPHRSSSIPSSSRSAGDVHNRAVTPAIPPRGYDTASKWKASRKAPITPSKSAAETQILCRSQSPSASTSRQRRGGIPVRAYVGMSAVCLAPHRIIEEFASMIAALDPLTPKPSGDSPIYVLKNADRFSRSRDMSHSKQ